ncbi:arginine--tRNA ligase [Candidatus Falkowbacteria bacterium]|nr:arginine--tRNA ligase [Candidatus Falkowbacteria bacterium]
MTDSMYILEKIKINIAEEINKALGNEVVKASDFVYPPNPELGDLSWTCFNKIKPGELAAEAFKLPQVKSAKWAGSYLNFILDKKYFTENIIKEMEKGKGEYGENKNGGGKRAMIEYSNANTHKEYHVGHLRNIAYGDSVARILAANGYKVIPVSYINDFGIHTAKTLWALEKFFSAKGGNEKFPLPSPAVGGIKGGSKGYFLGKIYARATKELAADPDARKEVEEIMKKIESRKGAEYKLWKKTREWSIEQFNEIYKELGVKFKNIFYENEFMDKGLKIISGLLEKGILEKSEGAVIADLEGFDNLNVLVFLRSDGTALYPVADLPLAIEKIKKYKLDKSIYVVDVRQSLYFKQLFKVLELMGYKKEMVHLGHEFVKLPSGMMSSRTGNVITYEELRTELLKKAKEETKKRHEGWNDKKIEEVAKKIMIGAMKFEMLKMGRLQTITFSVDEALQFNGFTAAYLQYTYARIRSIMRKSKIQNPKSEINPKSKIKNSKLEDKKEHGLILKLAKYPEVVARAGERYDPSEIAKYLFDLTQAFNDYYHVVPVLKAEDRTRKARLALIGAVSQVIKNGLELLGIKTLEEM